MIHGVTDTDTHFIIDGVTRTVKNETETKSMLVQFDHNSERFTFRVPRYVDGHDLAKCNAVRAHYINIDKSKRTQNSGANEITDLAICDDDDGFVMCSWLIPQEATQLAGYLHFVIQFACMNGDEMIYAWNTARHTGVTVADGINFGDIVVSENLDILTKWEKELKANHIVSVDQTTTSDADEGVNVWTATFGDGRTQDLKVRNGRRGATGRIGSIQTIQGNPLRFFVGTKKEYDALPDAEKTNNLLALFTDDKTRDEIEEAFEELQALIKETSDEIKATSDNLEEFKANMEEKVLYINNISICEVAGSMIGNEIRFQVISQYEVSEKDTENWGCFLDWMRLNFEDGDFIPATGLIDYHYQDENSHKGHIVYGIDCRYDKENVLRFYVSSIYYTLDDYFTKNDTLLQKAITNSGAYNVTIKVRSRRLI